MVDLAVMQYEYIKILEHLQANVADIPPNGTEGNHLIILTPCFSTRMTYFLFQTGFAMAARGKKVSFLWNDSDATWQNEYFPHHAQYLKKMTKLLSRDYSVIRISALPKRPYADISPIFSETDFNNLIAGSMVWYEGAASMVEERLEREKMWVQYIKENIVSLYELFASGNINTVVMNSNIGFAGIIILLSQYFNIDFVTFDGATIGLNNASVHFKNAPQVVSGLAESPKKELVLEIAEKHFRHRKKLVESKAKSQPEHAKKFCSDVVVFCGMLSDSASLILPGQLYPNQADWLVSTIKYVQEQTDSDITVRFHPIPEPGIKNFLPNCSFDNYIRNIFPSKRVKIVTGTETVSSYQLLENAKLAITYVSAAGIEASILGRQVLSCTPTYYSTSGFIRYANTKEKYYKAISEALYGSPQPLKNWQREKAFYYYFASQIYMLFREFREMRIPPVENIISESIFARINENSNFSDYIDIICNKKYFSEKRLSKIIEQEVIKDFIEEFLATPPN